MREEPPFFFVFVIYNVRLKWSGGGENTNCFKSAAPIFPAHFLLWVKIC